VPWNYPRVVSLARWGYAVGQITEKEAWAVIMPTAQTLQRSFSSWQEMGRAYLDARGLFFRNDLASRRENEWVYRAILMDPASPWRKYAWNLDLGGGPVSAAPAKSAELTLAVHPQGLMCARVRVPDHLDLEDHSYEPYLTALEKTVGCKPRLKNSSYDSKDWILDTECFNIGVSQGDLVIARLSIEAIAAVLRREGVTEMFTYVQHEAVGDSVLVPEAQDDYVDQELQWHSSTFTLSEILPNLTLMYGVLPSQTVPGGDRVKLAKFVESPLLALGSRGFPAIPADHSQLGAGSARQHGEKLQQVAIRIMKIH
jgi:hypothetical protein